MIMYIRRTPTSSFEKITVPDTPFSEGGQGKVFRILTPGYEEYCIKYYKPEYQDPNYDRIAYMIRNPPKNIMGSDSFRICWPVAFAYDDKKRFVGYMMPLAFPNSRDLLILSTYNSKPISQQPRYKKYTDWFGKFELDSETGVRNRMKMLCNWIIAIQSIHGTGKYVIIDLKPENVMATGAGKISIIDTDSFQISENGKILYPGSMFTPDYFPPEASKLHEKNLPITVACDRFAAAVCFYKILTGVHPYAGTIKKYPYDKIEQIQEAIKENLFAFGDKSSYLSFNEKFNLHKHFGNLTPDIQNLFKKAFGNNPAMRPGMGDWSKAFRSAINAKDGIKGNSVKPHKPTPTIEITGVMFGDTDRDGNIIRDYGYSLYTDMTYLTPRITYKVLKGGTHNVKIWTKIFSPSGRLDEGRERPGYSSSCSRTFVRSNPNKDHIYSMELGGWGNVNKSGFSEPGVWTVEFYEDSMLLYRRRIFIHPVNDATPSPASSKPSPTYSQPSSTTYPSQPVSTTSPADRISNKGCLIFILIAALIGGGGAYLNHLYKDKDTVKKYVIAKDAAFRKTDKTGVYDLIKYVPYGVEVKELSEDSGVANIKYDGKKGYIKSDYLLDKFDFELLNGVWANEKTSDYIYPTKCKLAILDFLKVNNLPTGEGGWRLEAEAFDRVPNNVLLCELTDGFDRYSEFAFILQNESTGKRMTAIYSFDNSGTPVLRHTEYAPSEGGLASISYNKKTKKYVIQYASAHQNVSWRNVPNNYPTDEDVNHNSDYKFKVRSIKETNKGYVVSENGSFNTNSKYLAPHIFYHKPNLGKEKLNLYIKIVDSQGNLLKDSKSPYGYTYVIPCELTLKSDEMSLVGWRPDNNSPWSPGDYKMEVWYNGEKQSEIGFTIKESK